MIAAKTESGGASARAVSERGGSRRKRRKKTHTNICICHIS